MSIEMEAPKATGTAYTNKTILVIDDEERLAQSLAALLRGIGYEVEAAVNGTEGMQRIRRKSYDLVITDLRMSEVDGFDIMQEIAEQNCGTALIVITGHASTNSAIEALQQRAADYITKPFDFDVLRNSVERVFIQQEAERLRRDTVNMLTHDIKVPLTNVLGFAQLISSNRSGDPERTAQYADTIALNCHKLLLMLDNYLTNARLEEGRLELVPQLIDLHDLVEETLGLFSHEFAKKEIAVQYNWGQEDCQLEADEMLLSRAVGNLVSNAAKYTPRGHRVRASIRSTFEETVLCLTNTGVRMTEEESRQLFHRYRRGSTSTGKDGTGLGLHIVSAVAEAHGGSAWCELAGDEISFHISLPRKLA